MKTAIKFLFILFISLTTTLSVQAQSHLRRSWYGDFFIGMTLASLDMEGNNEYKKNKIGFMVGGNLNYKFLGNMELQSGFHIIKKGSLQHQQTSKVADLGRIEKTDVKTITDANYIQVPFNIGFEAPIARELYVNAHVGLFAAYGFKGRTEKTGYRLDYYDGVPQNRENYNEGVETFSNEKLKRWDYGIGANFGLVYDIYILRVQYDHGLANIATADLGGKWTTKNYSISLGFRF